MRNGSSVNQNSTGQGTEARGQYIVEDLSRCGQCHTPRDSNGVPDRSRWLQGAPVWLKSAEPVEDWPLQAPRIAGALPGTDAEMVTLLTTGIWRTGTYLRPPMPQFRMSRQDAESVIAYLKSVKLAPK
ncbi:MAG: cytochrome c [Candidatus Sulfotelmatobacter sp.]